MVMIERGSVVSLGFIFPHPPEDEKKYQKKIEGRTAFAKISRSQKIVMVVNVARW